MEGGSVRDKTLRACYEALGRTPSLDDIEKLESYAREFGAANLCRALFNLNEFIYLD